MWLKNVFKKLRGLTFRLVFWNSVGFVFAAAITLFITDFGIRRYLNQRLDRQLATKLYEIKEVQADRLDKDLFISEIGHHSVATGVDTIFYRLLDAQGNELIHSDLEAWRKFPLDKVPLDRLPVDQPVWGTLAPVDGGPGGRIIFLKLASGQIVQVGLSTAERDQLRAGARWLITGAMLLVSLLGSVFAAFIAAKTLRGMRYVSRGVVQTARRGDFNQRISLPTGSIETDDLALSFNRAFAKIQELMRGMEQVLGDIAHDMRTPVTRVRGLAESILSEPDTTPREEELAGNTIEDCDRILGLVNTILEINAAEVHMSSLKKEVVDLSLLVAEGADLFRFMLEDKRLTLSLDLPEQAPTLGDKGYLQRIVSNLLDNAIKYTPEGGRIALRLRRLDGFHQLDVEDSGIGIPPAESELIFKRFYRGDKSRTHPGNGLGLTFCRAMITAMGGDIKLQPKPSPGSLFRVTLPAGEKGTVGP